MAKKKVSQSQPEKSLPKQEDFARTHKEVTPSMESEFPEKLESLKSLNRMLVKEAFERRQQVESLVQSKGCLEMELTRSNSEKVSLNTEVTRLTENAVVFELERDVVVIFVSVQLGLKGEVIVQKMRELNILVDEKDGEIGRLNGILSVTDGEIGRLNGILGNEREVSKRMCLERDEIKDKLDLQIEEGNGLRASLIESEERKGAVEREIEELRAACIAVETRLETVTKEKESIERGLVESNKLVEEMKEKVRVCDTEKEGIEKEKAKEMVRRQELEVELVGLDEKVVVGLRKEGLKLWAATAELEERCLVIEERQTEMEREKHELIKEVNLSEKKIEGLSGEKITIERDLRGALTNFEAMVSENIVVVEAKSRLESEVAELKAVVLELEEKVKGLESEVGEFEKEIERDEMRACLDEEKKNVARLKEMVRALESKIEEKVKVCEKVKTEKGTLFSEKVELERRCEMMNKEIRSLENTISEVRKELDSVKGEVGKADANAGVVLSLLRGTASAVCSEEGKSKSDVDLFGDCDETKVYVVELETIKNAFENKESKIGDMKRQLELLQGCVEDAHKKKSFLTVLSSATTLLAAVSLAYVARGH